MVISPVHKDVDILLLRVKALYSKGVHDLFSEVSVISHQIAKLISAILLITFVVEASGELGMAMHYTVKQHCEV